MTYTIKISESADKVIAKWKKSNPSLLKKFRKIYDDFDSNSPRLSRKSESNVWRDSL